MTGERDYRALVERLARLVERSVPPGARVLVVSRGDDALLRVPGREAGHFPQSPTGMYAGYHPRDGAEAAAHLADLRERGAEYLVLPSTARWWLEHYPELRAELEQHGEWVAEEPDAGAVVALRRAGPERPRPSREQVEAARVLPQAAALVRALVPEDAGVVVVGCGVTALDVGARAAWCVPAPDAEHDVDQVLARVDEARSEGARYVVLLDPPTASMRLDGRLRARLARAGRPVFDQRLAQGFELAQDGAVV